MIVFRQKYPRWWFDFNLAMLNFSTRVGAYVGLLTDEYPSTDEEQGVHITLEYPDASQLNRWLPLVKWLLAIPHYVVLFFLYIVAVILIILGWFAILLSGKFPRGIHDYLVGVTRWTLRVEAYALFLTTDKYPPFSLE
jgi:asparagine N-glycosylation enzyme membrane subunit Stt3